MNTSNNSAFDSLDARANALSKDAPADRISLREHIVEVEIGAFQVERGTTQRVLFDVVVEVKPHQKPLEDDVDRILSYDTITEAIANELAAERLNLLETLAERICQRILTEPQALRVYVRIQKLDRGSGALGVEIVRSRAVQADTKPILNEETEIHPLVVFLSNAAIKSEYLKDWINDLQATGKPIIFSVGVGASAVPDTDIKPAQRRINLLAAEQNAWVLAGRDPRCIVVDARTELDWAMRNGQISVWAPSRVVLDAVESPTLEGAALALWFAQLIQAEMMVVIGAEAPSGADIPVSLVSVDNPSIILPG